MILFKKIRYKNFLSTGNRFLEYNLNKNKTTLMVGRNGSGKSTILDAITFALFGKPFRDMNKPQLINSINNKDCLVEIEFTIGSNEYMVRRGIKPNVFDIIMNGNKLNKDADSLDYQKYLESQILKLNYKSFTQIVILGSSSFVPFMQLPAGERRVIIEDLLDITIFSSMNSVLKERVSLLKDKIKKQDTAIEVINGKMEIQQSHIDKINERIQANAADKQQDIDNKRKQIDHHTDEVAKLKKQIEDWSDSIKDEKTNAAKLKKLDEIKFKAITKMDREKSTIDFYENHTDCPECKQTIADEFREFQLGIKKTVVDDLVTGLGKLDTEFKQTSERADEIRSIGLHIADATMKIRDHSSEILALDRQITTIESSPSYDDDIEVENEKMREYQEEHRVILEAKAKLITEQKYHDVAQTLLKDSGVKSKIIKQYLPVINSRINKYLSDLNFYANFTLDENFKEEIKSRNRDSFSYGSFSEGQKMRIDLALLFTWRDVARMKNSVNTNLLFLDEIFDSSLDGDGTSEFTKLLKAVGTDMNIFLISHKTDQLLDKFDSVIRFDMKANFTTMKVG